MAQRYAKPPVLQYALLVLIAAVAMVHVGLGVYGQIDDQMHGMEEAGTPFFNGLLGRAIPLTDEQADRAGVPHGFVLMTLTMFSARAQHPGLGDGDAVYTIAGQPYTGAEVLGAKLTTMHPGDALPLTIWKAGTPLDSAPVPVTITVGTARLAGTSAFRWMMLTVFIVLPVFCLLTGFYVVAARPRNPHAWLILGILAYFTALFISPNPHVPVLYVLTHIFNSIGQAAMPVCFMLFGVLFPERSRLDRRAPWLKWVLMVPTFAILSVIFLYDFGQGYSFHDIGWVFPYLAPVNNTENIIGAIQITYAFLCLYTKLGDPEIGADARRRLRVLTLGSTAGLLPFFGLLLLALVKRTDVGENVPEWISLTIFAILFIFPLTLAYVVVVQRAMDVRILLRQGTKYFFARQSLFVISILLAMWMSTHVSRVIQNRGHNRAVDIISLLGVVAVFAAYRNVGSKRMELWLEQKFFREAYSTEQLMVDISEEARNFAETAPLLETITRRLGDTLHIDRIAVFLRSGEMFQLQFATGVGMQVIPSLPANSATIRTLGKGKAAPANVYRDDPSSWLVDATDSERTALDDLSTELLVPLPGRNRLVGVIALGPKSSEEPYSKSDRQMLQTVASQTGLAIENAELLEHLTAELAQKATFEREVEIAREVQERLFPQVYPEITGIGLAGYCRPARFVGGDYFDFFLISRVGAKDLLGIAIGDISGKGIPAALLMASLRASLRSVATLQGAEGERNLAGMMGHVNRQVFEASTSNRYATFFYAELDPATRVLTYVNAGHNCPVVLRDGEAIALEPTGTVIGLLQDAGYEQASVQMQTGDTLLAFTDGISEAMTAEDEEWGEVRMIAAAQGLLGDAACTYSAEQMMQCLLEKADAFTAGAPQHDDMTLLICTVG